MRPLAALALALVAFAAAPAAGDPPRPRDLPEATVEHVADGDTVTVRLGRRRMRLRLIGVDTPELHESAKLDRDVTRRHASRRAIQAMGDQAARFTRGRLLGARVGLEYDVQREDGYGRTLAYVWLADGTLWNAELLRTGMARTLTVPPNVRYVRLFTALQREARDARRGFWRAGGP